MNSYQSIKTIDAPAERVWQVLTNVENWPRLTPSITSVTSLDASPIAVGSRYRVEQPKLKPATYEVTHLETRRNFSWQAHSFGCRIKAEHLIRETDAASELVIRLTFHGFLAPLIGLLVASTTKEYIELEAQGFKNECEK